MKIKTKLNVSAIVLLVTAVVVTGAMIWSSRQVNQAIARGKDINEILKGVFELNLLSSDYLLYNSERARTQWRLRYSSLSSHLLSTEFTRPKEQPILARVRLDYRAIDRLFRQLIMEHERVQSGENEFSAETKERLVAQILIKSQSMVYDTLTLADITQRNIISVRNRVGMLALAFITIIVVQLLTTLGLVGNSVIRPMRLLEKGTELIAAGDLNHTVQLSARDEIGQLARAFNTMTERLRRSFKALEVEVRERKRAERELADEMEELDVTLKSIGDGVITADRSGNVRLINSVAESMTGWPADDAIGKPLSEIYLTSDAHSRQRGNGDAKSQAKGAQGHHPSVHQRTIKARDGREHPIADTQAPIQDKDGNLIGTVVVFRDITEQTTLQQESMRIQKLESVGVLAGGIAHDFNNILTAIMGSLSLASFDLDPGHPVYGLIKEAEKASTRAKKLTQQLLTFSKGGSPVKTKAFIEELLRESATFALRGSNVRCEFHVDPGLWTAEVDTGQISQVIQNLVINAQQAMKDGGVVRLHAQNLIASGGASLPVSPGKYIKITVADQGTGISPEILDKIFDPYFSTKTDGSGLGLAIIHSIIHNHGGYINVESKVSIGTKFHLYLPASQRQVVQPQRVAVDEPETQLVGRGKILIMDDEKVIGKIAGKMLNRLGYRFEIAYNGEHAIDMFLNARSINQPFNLVILDLTVRGGMGGKDVVKTLLEIDHDTRALVSSGYSNDPIMANYEEYGFKGVISKPYKFENLRETIEQYLPHA